MAFFDDLVNKKCELTIAHAAGYGKLHYATQPEILECYVEEDRESFLLVKDNKGNSMYINKAYIVKIKLL